MGEEVLARGNRALVSMPELRLQCVIQRNRPLPRTSAGRRGRARGRRRGRSRGRTSRLHRPPGASRRRRPAAPTRSGGDPPRAARPRSSSSPPCSRARRIAASRPAALKGPCPGSSNHRPRKRRHAVSRPRRTDPRAAGRAVCARSSPPHPTPPCRRCRQRPIAPRARPASRWSSAPPRCDPGRGSLRSRRGAISNRRTSAAG